MTLNPNTWLAQLPGPPNALWPQGARSVAALRHGSLELKLYAPRGSDPQQPHTRDEVYVVVAGHGVFDNGGVRTPFSTGDALFVPAGRSHRFVEFSEDFATWVVFYGPEGGEAA
jgi:mannose-6-phosphate isomerase-like protein (cupin superfamily)